jgi:hypothetical protein
MSEEVFKGLQKYIDAGEEQKDPAFQLTVFVKGGAVVKLGGKEAVHQEDPTLGVLKTSFNISILVLRDPLEVKNGETSSFVVEGSTNGAHLEDDGSFYSNVDLRISLTIKEWKKNWLTPENKVEIEAVLQHELTHMYEDFMRQHSKRVSSLLYTEDSLYSVIVLNFLENSEFPTEKIEKKVGEFLYYIYLQASHERNARVAEAAVKVSKAKTREEKEKKLKETNPWKFAEMLVSFSKEKFTRELKEAIAEWFKETHQRKNVDDTFLECIKMLENGIKNASQGASAAMHSDEKVKLENLIKRNLRDSARLALKTPEDFVAFWEKKFHAAGEEMKRKLYRLLSYEEE